MHSTRTMKYSSTGSPVRADATSTLIPGLCRAPRATSARTSSRLRIVNPSSLFSFFSRLLYFTIFLRHVVVELRCVCNRSSRVTGVENGNPLCTTCGPNMTATLDGTDCVQRANATCKCSTNQITCNEISSIRYICTRSI